MCVLQVLLQHSSMQLSKEIPRGTLRDRYGDPDSNWAGGGTRDLGAGRDGWGGRAGGSQELEVEWGTFSPLGVIHSQTLPHPLSCISGGTQM